MLAGIIAERISATPGTVPAASALPLSAAAALAGIGKIPSNPVLSSADMVPLASRITQNSVTARRAIAPPLAAASVCEMPV